MLNVTLLFTKKKYNETESAVSFKMLCHCFQMILVLRSKYTNMYNTKATTTRRYYSWMYTELVVSDRYLPDRNHVVPITVRAQLFKASLA